MKLNNTQVYLFSIVSIFSFFLCNGAPGALQPFTCSVTPAVFTNGETTVLSDGDLYTYAIPNRAGRDEVPARLQYTFTLKSPVMVSFLRFRQNFYSFATEYEIRTVNEMGIERVVVPRIKNYGQADVWINHSFDGEVVSQQKEVRIFRR